MFMLSEVEAHRKKAWRVRLQTTLRSGKRRKIISDGQTEFWQKKPLHTWGRMWPNWHEPRIHDKVYQEKNIWSLVRAWVMVLDVRSWKVRAISTSWRHNNAKTLPLESRGGWEFILIRLGSVTRYCHQLDPTWHEHVIRTYSGRDRYRGSIKES